VCGIKYASKLSSFCYVQKSSKFLVSFIPAETLFKCLDASMLKTVVFELVQQFYHATEICNVASAVSPCAAQPQQTKQRSFPIK